MQCSTNIAFYDDLLAPKGESKCLAFDLSQLSGGKLFTDVLLLVFVYREPVSQKEQISTYLEILVIFCSIQSNGVKTETVNYIFFRGKLKKSDYRRSMSAI